MSRLFVAVDLPEGVKDLLVGVREAIPGARWVPREQLHLTLRFIGDTQEPLASRVQELLAEVHGGPFPLTLAGTGHFPPRREPRVLWVGLHPSPPLLDLQRQMETALQRAGIPAEGRPFSPHLTLARLKESASAAVADFEKKNGALLSEPFAVDAFHLYASTLTPSGAVHRRVRSYPLG